MKNRLVFLMFILATSFNASASAQVLDGSIPFTYDDGNGNTLLYRLFLPPGHDEPGAEFPLVLYMHGSGQIGTDNVSQLLTVDGLVRATQSERYASFLLAPQVQPGQGGWGRQTRELTLDVIEQLEQQFAIDTTREYVTGLSLGGFGTWGFVADNPDRFAAAVPLSSSWDPADASKFLNTRVWSFNGGNDSVTPAGPNRAIVQAIRDEGGSAIYTETDGGHAIWGPIYDDPNGDLYNWLFEEADPPLAQLIYNPHNGQVLVDAQKAPGGAIESFTLSTLAGSFSLPSTVVVDGAVVDASSFFVVLEDDSITYNGRGTGGFREIVDLGPIFVSGIRKVQRVASRFWRHKSAARQCVAFSDLRS